MRDIMRKVIEQFVIIDADGLAFGLDTEIGDIETLIDSSLAILQRELIDKPLTLKKRILFEMVDWGGFTLKQLAEE